MERFTVSGANPEDEEVRDVRSLNIPSVVRKFAARLPPNAVENLTLANYREGARPFYENWRDANLPDDVVVPWFKANKFSIRRFAAPDVSLSANAVAVLVGLPNLQVVDLSGQEDDLSDGVSDATMARLAETKKLTSFSIQCPLHLTSLRFLADLKGLRTLNVTHCEVGYGLNPGSFSAFCTGGVAAGNLTELDISKSHAFEGTDLLKDIGECISLKTLIADGLVLDDDGAGSLKNVESLNKLHHLVHLCLAGTEGMNRALPMLKLPNLEHLDMSEKLDLTKDSLIEFAKSPRGNLVVVNISGGCYGDECYNEHDIRNMLGNINTYNLGMDSVQVAPVVAHRRLRVLRYDNAEGLYERKCLPWER